MHISPAAFADETAILAGLKSFFQAAKDEQQEKLVRQIQADPAYDRAKVAGWLNRVHLFETLKPGAQTLEVKLDNGTVRNVVLRLPSGYQPQRAWPLILALHGSGGNGESFLKYVEMVLGDARNDFILAAPTGYEDVIIANSGKNPTEHLAVLRALKRKIHINSDRVYVLGYSRGGHASWTLAVQHPDLFAGAVPLAGSLVLPEIDKLWDPFLSNVANTAVFHAWGAKDIYLDDGKTPSPDGGTTKINRQLQSVAEKLKLPVTAYEAPDKGHGNVVPPAETLMKLLKQPRNAYPKTVRHTFRWIHEAQAYWLEGFDWRGPAWDSSNLGSIELQPNEDPQAAIARGIRNRLGELRGEIEGQLVKVHGKHVGEFIVWFGDGLIDWQQPVRVELNGRKVFEGKIEPDLFVCLSQAARTYDFARLRWAGLRIKLNGNKAELVTGRMVLPS